MGDGAFVAVRHRRLTLQLGVSGSTRSLRLPHLLGTLGMRQELMNEDAGSAGGAAELKLDLRNHAKGRSGVSWEGGGGRQQAGCLIFRRKSAGLFVVFFLM